MRQDIYEPPLAERDWLMDTVPVKQRAEMLSGMSLVVRVDGDPMAIVPAVRAAIHDVDPTVPFKEAETMTDVVTRDAGVRAHGELAVRRRLPDWRWRWR